MPVCEYAGKKFTQKYKFKSREKVAKNQSTSTNKILCNDVFVVLSSM